MSSQMNSKKTFKEEINIYPSQTIPKNCRARNTSKVIDKDSIILMPKSKTSRKKRKSQASINDKHRCKNHQHNISKTKCKNTLKGPYTMIKKNSLQGFKESSNIINQSM